jgi:hypothetical protein
VCEPRECVCVPTCKEARARAAGPSKQRERSSVVGHSSRASLSLSSTPRNGGVLTGSQARLSPRRPAKAQTSPPPAAPGRADPGFRGLESTQKEPLQNWRERRPRRRSPPTLARRGRAPLYPSPLSPPLAHALTARHRAGATREEARRSMVGGWARVWVDGVGAEPRERRCEASIES